MSRAAAPIRAATEYAVVAAAVYFVTPPQRTSLLRVLTVAAFLLVAVKVGSRVATGQRARPRLWEVQVELAPPGQQSVRLARLETSFTYAGQHARHFHRVIRPLLHGLVEDRLARHHGIDMRTSPAAARAIIGEELWQLFQADPDDRPDGPGPTPAQLDRLVAAVEGVGRPAPSR